MGVSIKSILAAGLVAGALGGAASAAQITISSTVPQSGYNGDQNLPSYPLTDPAGPFDFTGQDFASLTSIDSIFIQLSVFDGNNGPGEFDFDSFTLALDGIDTGIKLNSLVVTAGQNVTIDATGLPNNAAAILAALQADGKLSASVFDATPLNAPQGNTIGFSFQLDTTLDITGTVSDGGPGPNPIPLPLAALMAPLGAGMAGYYSRRFRRKA